MIRQIFVDMVTAFSKGASTRGEVYLGLGGREFRLDLDAHHEIEEGDEVTYVFGERANVANAERNDPRKGMPLRLEDIPPFPAYIRLVPHNKSDDWNVANIRVRVVATEGGTELSALDGSTGNIWLGTQSGTMLYLRPSARG